MRFWDSSALAALLVDEAVTPAVERLLAQDPIVFAWWGTRVECASAIAKLERERHLTGTGAAAAFDRLRELQRGWQEVQPAEELRESAVRLLRVHSLTAADALQLAAAFVAAERRPPSMEFVSFDRRLADAARREGFVVVEVTSPPAREPKRRYAARAERAVR